MTYMVVNVLINPGSQIPESNRFAKSTWLPQMHELLAAIGVTISRSPLNLAFTIALIASVLVWLFIWKTKWGYAVRVVGQSENAAIYGGISPARQIMLAMTISGALAAGVALNELLGSQHRLILNFPSGFGFVGIAVALMGRNHPVGIILAALLFGALYQGGSELSFDMPTVSRDIVVVIQGLVILFAGALEHMFRPSLEALFARGEPAGGGVLMEFLLQAVLLSDSTIRLAVPLVLAALAGLFAERSGVVDIGLEGKMLGAAFAAASVAFVTGSALAGLLAAMGVSICLSMLHGFACITHRGDQVVSGMALNIMVAGLGPDACRSLVPTGWTYTWHRGRCTLYRRSPCPFAEATA